MLQPGQAFEDQEEGEDEDAMLATYAKSNSLVEFM